VLARRAGPVARMGIRSVSVLFATVLLGIPLSAAAEKNKRGSLPTSTQSKAEAQTAGSQDVGSICADQADDPLAEEFRVHYQRSVELYRAQDYPAAITAMQRAYKLKPVTRLLYNLGQAHRKLQQPREAITYFELYLKTETKVPEKAEAEVRGHLQQLRILLAEQEKARVVVLRHSTPPPRWLRPTGFTLLGVGVASLGIGAALWALNGQCVDTPAPPIENCDRVYTTLPLGASLVGVGGGLVLTSVGFLIGSIQRGSGGKSTEPMPSQAPPSSAPPPSDLRAPLVPAPVPIDPDVEPPPAPLQLSFRF